MAEAMAEATTITTTTMEEATVVVATETKIITEMETKIITEMEVVREAAREVAIEAMVIKRPFIVNDQPSIQWNSWHRVLHDNHGIDNIYKRNRERNPS